jgi:hypothetical protein
VKRRHACGPRRPAKRVDLEFGLTIPADLLALDAGLPPRLERKIESAFKGIPAAAILSDLTPRPGPGQTGACFHRWSMQR